MGYARENMKGRLKPVRRLSDDLCFSKKQSVGRTPATVGSTYRHLQNSCAENTKRSQLIIAKTSGMPSLPYCGCFEYTGSSEKSPRRFSDDLFA
ncbi:hypothetical protein NEIMUCOT_06123 [Neisseria mucosa ATCC 25996]|uniref:Uncharacterized protein n=1 Tax=Neisseria mucosa (strain ATCC 25996 / DSM 4631 / NCTC 10774 / M26) TaxID=546266 RepID=D2ZZP6_NEIM2|nr:hypothetical protein NEIMUCOT_06123 [Neisseria mucosa ATCC 25996]